MLQTLSVVNDATLASIAEEKQVRRTQELFLLFTLGSQFDHLIKQALDKLGVFCLVANPATLKAADVRLVNPTGLILSGGPASVHSEPPPFDCTIFDLGIPTLGICLGFQLWAGYRGVPVIPAGKREFGTHQLNLLRPETALFLGCKISTPVLHSHGDRIELDSRLEVLASTDNAPVAAGQIDHLYGVQFHPEVTETEEGLKMLENFCFGICGAKDRFPAEQVAQQKILHLREQIGNRKVLLALSGGSDSSVVAYLLKEAVADHPSQLQAVYIKGIDRPDDEQHVLRLFGNQPWLQLKVVDATKQFLAVLKGKISMVEKRLAMRGVYREILEQEAAAVGAGFIAQGTLYTDLVESGHGYGTGARRAEIKVHHNTNLKFTVPEITPLDDCVKDNARNIGREIGVPDELLIRHPFPGPGLVVRIEGEVNETTLKIARQVDGIFIAELRNWKLYDTVWQAGAVVTQSITTCSKGDDAAQGVVVALFAVWSVNGFTARAAELPYDFLKHVSRRITNEVREVGSVVYRVSDKPPTTIEWG